MDTIKLPTDDQLTINDRVRGFVAKQIEMAANSDKLTGRTVRVFDTEKCNRLQAIINWANATFRSEKTGDSYIQDKTTVSFLYGMTDAQIESELTSQIEMRKRTAGRRAAVKKYGREFVSAKIGRNVQG